MTKVNVTDTPVDDPDMYWRLSKLDGETLSEYRMTDQPSEAALRKACEVLEYTYREFISKESDTVRLLARHFDAEDKAAREAWDSGEMWSFFRRHILPDPKPTVEQVVAGVFGAYGCSPQTVVQALREAGLLREEAPSRAE
jgi:hypothetical protein